MTSLIGRTAYLVKWQLGSWLGKRRPLQSVIFILDKCNLKCKHCSVYAIVQPRIKSFKQIEQELQYCYDLGSRFIDFEGGELYLWKDEQVEKTYTIDDVIDLAHKIGFWNVTITTNAQLPFTASHADHVWVSMDGVGQWHDEIRGKGTFERLEKNIKLFKSERQDVKVCVNMVINNLNYSCLDDVFEYVRQSLYIDGIAVNFHTPFAETEQLYLDPTVRNLLIERTIDFKRRGYPIINTVSGLKAMRVVDGKVQCTNKSCWITNFIFSDGSRAPKCMGFTHDVCDRCGFTMGGEMRSVWLLKPDTLIGGMKLRI